MKDHARRHERHAAALAAAARGWHVLVCQPRLKQPATRRGLNDATTDPHRIDAWFRARPSLNYGIACGPSGLVVIDCDDLEVKGSGTGHGLDRLEQLAEGHGARADLDTYTVRSPLAGVHLYYVAGAVPIRPSAGRLAPGVDVRGGPSYVLGEQSVLGDERRLFDSYELLDGSDPKPLPGWLEHLLAADQAAPDPPALSVWERLERQLDAPAVTAPDAYAATVLANVCDDVAAARNGTRNATLHRAALRAGSMVRDRGLDVGEAARALLDAATTAGLEVGEARGTIRSGLAWAIGGGR